MIAILGMSSLVRGEKAGVVILPVRSVIEGLGGNLGLSGVGIGRTGFGQCETFRSLAIGIGDFSQVPLFLVRIQTCREGADWKSDAEVMILEKERRASWTLGS